MDIRNEKNQIVSHYHFSIIFHKQLIFLLFFYSDASNVRKFYNNFNFVQFLLNLVPVLKWLPKYSIKNDLAGDLSAGITVAVMHIPQGNFTIDSHVSLRQYQ